MLIDIYRQAYFNRCFEYKVIEAHKLGLMKYPFYLSIGTEHIPATIADVSRDWLVFPQHRCHSWLLSFGSDPSLVAREVVGKADGLNHGMAGSASLGDPSKGIYGHDGLLGTNAPIAVGACHASGKPTVVHLGDASVEEDYVIACFGYAARYNLPILFIVEDNNLSILTPTNKRRNWNIVDVAKGFGIQAVKLDNKYYQAEQLRRSIEWQVEQKPRLINIVCERHYWHAFSGMDATPQTDNLKDLRMLTRSDGQYDFEEIEEAISNQVDEIWEPILNAV